MLAIVQDKCTFLPTLFSYLLAVTNALKQQ